MWKQTKKAIKTVKGSASYKILEISQRVDRLTEEYALWKMHRSKDVLKVLRGKLKDIKDELVKLSLTTPDVPKIGKNMGTDAAYNILNAKNTAEMAQAELVRIVVEQLEGNLPEDDVDNWPATRKRLLANAEVFRRTAVGFRSQIVSANRDLREADALQDELKDIRNDPYMTPDQLDELERDYKESLSNEAEIKTLQGRLDAMAKAADQAAANLERHVELGDLARQTQKK
jgi:hypothetical protein